MKEVAWREFDRNDRLTTKRKVFQSETAMQRFIAKLEQKSNFHSIVATR